MTVEIKTEELKKVLKKSIEEFYEKDKDLIDNNVHEQTITHRIAHYLEDNTMCLCKCQGYSVDVEYNRCVKDVKNAFKYYSLCPQKQNSNNIICLRNIEQKDNEKAILEECADCKTECKYKNKDIETLTKNIRPDILIHRRGRNDKEDNLLVVEVKKNKNDTKCDERKLTYLTCNYSQYKYQLGAFIVINKNQIEITYFKNHIKKETRIGIFDKKWGILWQEEKEVTDD